MNAMKRIPDDDLTSPVYTSQHQLSFLFVCGSCSPVEEACVSLFVADALSC